MLQTVNIIGLVEEELCQELNGGVERKYKSKSSTNKWADFSPIVTCASSSSNQICASGPEPADDDDGEVVVLGRRSGVEVAPGCCCEAVVAAMLSMGRRLCVSCAHSPVIRLPSVLWPRSSPPSFVFVILCVCFLSRL